MPINSSRGCKTRSKFQVSSCIESNKILKCFITFYLKRYKNPSFSPPTSQNGNDIQSVKVNLKNLSQNRIEVIGIHA